jgi:hypothetical protein
MTLIEVLCRQFYERTEENHAIPLSGLLVSWLEFELGASWLRVKSVTENPTRLVSALLSGLRINTVQSQDITRKK